MLEYVGRIEDAPVPIFVPPKGFDCDFLVIDGTCALKPWSACVKCRQCNKGVKNGMRKKEEEQTER
jgi:hypothetical protein